MHDSPECICFFFVLFTLLSVCLSVCHAHTHTLSLTLSISLTHYLTHTLSHSLTHSLSLSLTLSLTLCLSPAEPDKLFHADLGIGSLSASSWYPLSRNLIDCPANARDCVYSLSTYSNYGFADSSAYLYDGQPTQGGWSPDPSGSETPYIQLTLGGLYIVTGVVTTGTCCRVPVHQCFAAHIHTQDSNSTLALTPFVPPSPFSLLPSPFSLLPSPFSFRAQVTKSPSTPSRSSRSTTTMAMRGTGTRRTAWTSPSLAAAAHGRV